MWLVNGQSAAGLSPVDRGVAYGDGVFRTLRTRSGAPLWWQDHYAVLARDCAALDLPCPDAELLLQEVQRVAAGADAAVKILITRGEGARGYAPSADATPTRIVAAFALPAPLQSAANGATVRWCALRLARQPALAGIKHLNRLENVRARAEWRDVEIAEGVLCDDTGAVIGGTSTSLFMITDGGLRVPDLSQSGIDGVTRRRVLRAAHAQGVDVQVCRVDANAVLAAEEIFLGNSLAGLTWVARLDNRRWPEGRWTQIFSRWIYETD